MLAAGLIIGLSIGFFVGYMVGGRGVSQEGSRVAETDAADTDRAVMDGSENGQAATDGGDGEGTIPQDSFAVDDAPALTINGKTIYLSEVNARAYMARDHYVSIYGEEPWGMETEEGITVAEYAKETMLEEMKRVIILCGKAEEYQVPALTEDEKADCAAQADDYMSNLGSDVAAQFNLDRDAMQTIYEKDALAMKVYNQILADLTASLRSEAAYADMDDGEFETVLTEQFEAQYALWQDECTVETTETWEQMVIGAVG